MRARLEEASQLPHVLMLCCHNARPNLLERHVEQAGIQALELAGWLYLPVSAENGKGTGKNRKRDARAAVVGALDGVAYEPLTLKRIPRMPWWVEWKRGDNDLSPEQLDMVKRAPDYGVRVIICDESSLLKEWLNR